MAFEKGEKKKEKGLKRTKRATHRKAGNSKMLTDGLYSATVMK